MSKERERLNFNWQKSNNQYMILLTIIISIFSSQSVIPDKYKIYSYWILGITITLFGLSMISLNVDELVYSWKGLRDKRIKVTPFRKISVLIIYFFQAFVGLVIIFLGGYLLLILAGLFTHPLG